MPQYNVSINGVNRVRNDLRKLVSLNKTTIDPVIKSWAQTQRKSLKRPYPPPRAGQTYVRTGRLGNSFAVVPIRSAHYEITNTAPYSSYVIGDDSGPLRQAWMHSGRWFQMSKEIEKELPALRADIERALSSLWAD